ncbi:MAG: hypothetical protein M0C28_19285 [Candidatus Moduliflexus flocculans]|nr:hypothetical protein [Candidatus Moduliflexus flocculans]
MSDTNDTIENNPEDFSELVKDYDLKNRRLPTPPIEGRIVDIVENRVVIDIGQKTEGHPGPPGAAGLGRQHEIQDRRPDLGAAQERQLQGRLHHRFQKAAGRAGRLGKRLPRLQERTTPLLGPITKLTPDEKGFMVDMGVEMFLPMSQVDIQKVKAPKKMLGKDFMFKVVKLNKKDKSGTVSRRILLEEEKQEKLKTSAGVRWQSARSPRAW